MTSSSPAWLAEEVLADSAQLDEADGSWLCFELCEKLFDATRHGVMVPLMASNRQGLPAVEGGGRPCFADWPFGLLEVDARLGFLHDRETIISGGSSGSPAASHSPGGSRRTRRT